jgi:hypothetical protein
LDSLGNSPESGNCVANPSIFGFLLFGFSWILSSESRDFNGLWALSVQNKSSARFAPDWAILIGQIAGPSGAGERMNFQSS